MSPFRLSVVAIAALALLAPTGARAAALVPVAPFEAWGSLPLHAASPPGDARLFVVERGGNVRVVEAGVLREPSFLTVPNVDSSGERGLLSIAFPPDYASSGLFYVFTVAAGPDALDPSALPGDARVVEYRRSASDPNLADPASARLVLKQEHSSANYHYGGQLAFGPDGYLYVTMGDAGNGANAQALGNDLGKVLRIDPRDPGAGSFSAPPSNPFVGVGGARPEVYALGLRNPYRASFGPGGELIVADVGETAWEEVNLGTPTGTPAATTLAGANLGWPNCEGACTPPNGSFIDPFFQYGHGPTPAETTGCAIIGGYVVRDPALTGLTGRYLYGDRCRDDLRTLDLAAPGGDPRPAGLTLPAESGAPLGFGEDSFGCIYVTTDSTVFRVAASATAGPACPSAPAGPVGADRTPPRLRLNKTHRLPLRRFIPLTATCDEACTVRANGRLVFPGARASAVVKLVGASKSGAANRPLRLRLKLSRAAFRRATRARSHGHRVIARIVVTATDASGNTARRAKRIALR